MKHELEFKGLKPADEMRKLIERQVADLERKLQRLSSKPLFLRCLVERVPVRRIFRVSLILEVPRKTLSAKTETHEANAAIREAFQEIERQVDEYKSALAP